MQAEAARKGKEFQSPNGNGEAGGIGGGDLGLRDLENPALPKSWQAF